jgi:hypothetical protein
MSTLFFDITDDTEYEIPWDKHNPYLDDEEEEWNDEDDTTWDEEEDLEEI